MHFAIPAFIVGTLIRSSLGGTLQVIDEDRECRIYSSDVHGCTGYSASFAKLNGEDCSDLAVAVNSTRLNFSYIDVAVCGQLNGKNVAWIMVNQTGEVTFFNQNGDNAGCKLNNGLNTGSSCSASDSKSSAGTIANTAGSTMASLSWSLATSTTSSSSPASKSSDTGSAMSTCACA